MEQSVLKDQDRRWVDAIVKLTTMTYDGRLKWDRTNAGESSLIITETYVTKLADQSFSVIAQRVRDGHRLNTIAQNSLTVSFSVYKGGITVKNLDNLTVVHALVDAVRATTDNKEDDVLKAIEMA